MTYVDYYKSHYKLDVIDKNQPLLLSRVKVKIGFKETEDIKIISIVPQFCFVAGMDREQRSDEAVMKDLKRYTFSTPAQRVRALSAFLIRLEGDL
jgi:hypothetical protein